MNNKKILFVLGAAALAAGRPALADDYHYNNMLIGDRASGMGGSYVGISDDASGLYYNPAGVAYSGGRNLSASVNAFHISSITYKNVLGGNDWTRQSAGLLPNFFGVVQPFGPGVVGFSYTVTDAMNENLDQKFSLPNTEEFIVNLNNNDQTYKLGPSFAMEVSDGLAVGLTLYGHSRSSEMIMNQPLSGHTREGTSGYYEWSSVYLQSSETGLEPVLGIMWTPFERLSIGASVRKNTIITSEFKSQNTCITNIPTVPSATGDICRDATGQPNTAPTSRIIKSNDRRVYPLQLSLGMAYFATEKLLYAADFHYYGSATGTTATFVDDPVRSKVATWNASAGLEYYPVNDWALRAGIFTNRANTPTIQSGLTGQPEHVDMAGFSASASRFTRSSSITAGLSYSQGSGKAQVVSSSAAVQDVSQATATFFLSTSYTY